MTTSEKIVMVKAILGIAASDTSEDDRLSVYLSASEKEILAWRYSYATTMPSTVPLEYEMTQVNAVIAGFAISGAENQTVHLENGIRREFKYEDMISYIRCHVIPMAGVM